MLLLLFFKFNKSFLKNFIINEIGVITPKKIMPITIGETMLPSNNPNLNQALFSGDKTDEFNRPSTKKIKTYLIGLQNLNLKVK